MSFCDIFIIIQLKKTKVTISVNLLAIITALGGRHAIQQLLNVGPSAISNYMTRGHLPERAKPIIYAALTQKGYQIRADDLEILASPPATSSQPLHHDTHSGKRILLIVAGGIAAYKAVRETIIRVIHSVATANQLSCRH